MLNDEKVEAFLLKSGTRQGYPLWPLFLNITLEILINAVRQDNKRYTVWQGRNKVVFVHRWYDFKENLLLFSHLSCIWLFMTSFVRILKKLVELIKLKDTGGTQESVAFLYTRLSYMPAMNKWNWKL